jgi:hypothetical protein
LTPVEHRAATAFWKAYQELPPPLRTRAIKQFAILKANPQHPSLQFKKVGDRFGNEIWSARVTLSYRALAIKRPDGYLWFWIGDHEGYDSILA